MRQRTQNSEVRFTPTHLVRPAGENLRIWFDSLTSLFPLCLGGWHLTSLVANLDAMSIFFLSDGPLVQRLRIPSGTRSRSLIINLLEAKKQFALELPLNRDLRASTRPGTLNPELSAMDLHEPKFLRRSSSSALAADVRIARELSAIWECLPQLTLWCPVRSAVVGACPRNEDP
jgi:hypothetical protein